MSEDTGEPQAPKRNALPWADVLAMVDGIDRYEKTSFLVIGHRGGTRLAIPKTSTGVSRAYFYGTYEQLPIHPAITAFSVADRKRLHRGGIIAEVNFELSIEEATAGLAALVGIVRGAAPPAPRGEKKPRPAKVAKAIEPDPVPPADGGEA